MNAKEKSANRWKVYNVIIDKMIRNLPARHGLALLVCFRHANIEQSFRMSANDLSKTLGVHLRNARRLLDDLIEWEVIEVVEQQRGTIPRTFRITGKLSKKPPSVRAGVPTKKPPSVRAGVP